MSEGLVKNIWTEDDLKFLVTSKAKESLVLEYKRCAALVNNDLRKNELSKDVSAFANSAGGTIVYGIIETKNLPTAVDEGYDPTKISREWLEQVINSRIQRKIDGIHINQVDIDDGKKVVYVVTIPQSLRAPHMAADNKYYKRHNFQSIPMEDYEVRDVMNRSEAPELFVTVRLENEKSSDALQRTSKEVYSEPEKIYFGIGNHSDQVGEYAVIQILIDNRIRITDYAGFKFKEGMIFKNSDSNTPVTLLSRNWGMPTNVPIFKGLEFTLTPHNSEVQISIPPGDGQYLVHWEVLSPKMPPSSGAYDLVHKNDLVTLIDRAI